MEISPLFALLNRSAANPFLDRVFPALTSAHQHVWFLVVLGVVALAALAWGGRRGRLWVIAALVAVGLSDVTCSRVLKKIIKVERPCRSVLNGRYDRPEAAPRVVNIERCPGSPSFPSNHSANMMALGAVCWWFTKGRKRWAWALLPLVIGYTRVYLGYHYPTDVLAGWLVGAVIAWATLRCLPRDPGLPSTRQNDGTSHSAG